MFYGSVKIFIDFLKSSSSSPLSPSSRSDDTRSRGWVFLDEETDFAGNTRVLGLNYIIVDLDVNLRLEFFLVVS